MNFIDFVRTLCSVCVDPISTKLKQLDLLKSCEYFSYVGEVLDESAE